MPKVSEADRNKAGQFISRHGHTSSRNGRTAVSRTYQSWMAMKARCLNPRVKDFARYGGRGITLCDRWLDFNNFLADMGVRPLGMSIERRKNDKGYSPENCYWATLHQQGCNRRTSRLLTVNGITDNLYNWTRKLGIHRSTVEQRLAKGWSDKDALLTPVRGTQCHE